MNRIVNEEKKNIKKWKKSDAEKERKR